MLTLDDIPIRSRWHQGTTELERKLMKTDYEVDIILDEDNICVTGYHKGTTWLKILTLADFEGLSRITN